MHWVPILQRVRLTFCWWCAGKCLMTTNKLSSWFTLLAPSRGINAPLGDRFFFLSYQDAIGAGKRCAQPFGPREPVSSRLLDGRVGQKRWMTGPSSHRFPSQSKMATLLTKPIPSCSVIQDKVARRPRVVGDPYPGWG